MGVANFKKFKYPFHVCCLNTFSGTKTFTAAVFFCCQSERLDNWQSATAYSLADWSWKKQTLLETTILSVHRGSFNSMKNMHVNSSHACFSLNMVGWWFSKCMGMCLTVISHGGSINTWPCKHYIHIEEATAGWAWQEEDDIKSAQEPCKSCRAAIGMMARELIFPLNHIGLSLNVVPLPLPKI